MTMKRYHIELIWIISLMIISYMITVLLSDDRSISNPVTSLLLHDNYFVFDGHLMATIYFTVIATITYAVKMLISQFKLRIVNVIGILLITLSAILISYVAYLFKSSHVVI
jgi:hypothetical protein